MKLKHVVDFYSGATPDTADEAFWSAGMDGTPWVAIGDMSGRSRVTATSKRLTPEGLADRSLKPQPPGTVLFAMYASVGAVSTLGVDAVWNQAILGLRPKTGASDSRFVSYWLRHYAEIATSEARAATQANLNAEQVANFPFTDASLAQQRRIADFLDDRVARIDQIITARRQQIVELRERWSAELELAFAEVLDRTRASRLVRVLPGFAFPSDDFSVQDSDRRLLRGVNVGIGTTKWDEVVHWPQDRVEEVREYVLDVGDLVMGMDRPWIGEGLRIARIREEDGRPLLLQRVAKISSRALTSEYLYWAYQSRNFRYQVESDLTGLSVPHLSGEQIGSFELPVCDARRQAEVVAALDAGSESMQALIAILDSSVERLTEYKQSLITAAVAGEIDVTTAGSGIRG